MACTPIVQSNNHNSHVKQSALFMIDSIHKPNSVCNITVSFGYSDYDNVNPSSSWSHIGKNCHNQLPAINLGFIDPPFEGSMYTPDPDADRNYSDCPNWTPGSTVIHEICHSYCLMHEHQNDPNLELNIPAIINYYNSIGMTEEDAYTNVIDVYKKGYKSNYGGSEFDKDSIMLYSLPDEWFIHPEKNVTKPNLKLSKMDIEKLQFLYPKKNGKEPYYKNLDNIEQLKKKEKKENTYPTLRYIFIDSDTPAWKIAWVKKVITETFLPIIGINYEFYEMKPKDDLLCIIPKVKVNHKELDPEKEKGKHRIKYLLFIYFSFIFGKLLTIR